MAEMLVRRLANRYISRLTDEPAAEIVRCGEPQCRSFCATPDDVRVVEGARFGN